MLVLSNEEVGQLLTMEDCLEALERLYLDYAHDKALLTLRHDNLSPNSTPQAYYAFKHMGGTWPAEGIQALRLNSDVITHPVINGKIRRVKQPLANGRWVGLVMLFSTETGQLLAMFPDGVMQRIRVGAANGIALKHLAREDVSKLALIGSGWQAGAQLMAAMSVRNFKKVRVYSTRKENRESFVEEVKPLYTSVDIEVADTAEECVDDADVIMSATSAMIPVLQPEWIKPGMHISCIKTYEMSPEVLDKCDVVFIHTQAQGKHIDNTLPGTPNVFDESKQKAWVNDRDKGVLSHPDIKKLVARQAPGRESPEQVTCFVNNIGMGLQFAAAGAVVYKKAMESGVGIQLEDDWFSEDVHP